MLDKWFPLNIITTITTITIITIIIIIIITITIRQVIPPEMYGPCRDTLLP